MNPNDQKKPSVPPRSNRNDSEFFQKKGNEPNVPPGDPLSEERNSKKLDALYDLGSPTKEQVITYIILVIGLIAVFINTLIGGLIIGGVAGYYFSTEIIDYVRNIGQIFSTHDPLRHIIIIAVLIGLFIAAPGFFIGAIIVAGITYLLFSGKEAV